MSTANFKVENASKYYVFGTNVYVTQEDIDEGYRDEDQLGQFDEWATQDNYDCDLANAKYELIRSKGWSESKGWDGDRSYPGSYFAEKTSRFYYGYTLFEITIQAKVVDGYYEGATFDYDASLRVLPECSWHYGYDYYDYDLFGNYEFCEECVIDDNLLKNLGLSKIHAKNVVKKVYAELQKLCDEAESVFQMNSEYRLGCMGYGSNGEAFYYDTEDCSKRQEMKAQLAV